MDDYEKEIEELYIKLRDKVTEENNYLKEKREIDEKILSDLVMEKRIITDKIDKRSDPKKLSNISKIRIQALIKDMIKIEDENEKLYLIKMEGIEKEILNMINGKKLKNKFSSGESQSFFIDEKK